MAEIRRDLEEASRRRAALWEELSRGYDAVRAAEATRLSKRIEELWAEARIARVRAANGPSEKIISRARAEDRLDREARRYRDAA